jgi:Kef-type K+ transport system membrane component KefB
MSATDLTTRFFLAAAVILIVCKLVSLLIGRAGQPPVVGEMIAGVLLGPSLLGERDFVPARVGTLMNARGLMQLIALNVGLQAGLATQDLFTSLVLVALITTIMTAPLLSLIDRREAKTVAVTRVSPELGGVVG